MSKKALKKELENLTKPQLVEVIIAAYASNVGTKEYFDFFLNPDVDALITKYKELIAREFKRTKRGNQSKARISVIKGYLKKFAGFDPGVKHVLDLYIYAVEESIDVERRFYLKVVQYESFARLVSEFMKISEANESFSDSFQIISSIIETKPTDAYKRYLKAELQRFIDRK